MTVNDRQFIGLQVPTHLAIAEFDAALKHPQQRQSIAFLLAQLTDIANHNLKSPE
jgi:hypothetical protein